MVAKPYRVVWEGRAGDCSPYPDFPVTPAVFRDAVRIAAVQCVTLSRPAHFPPPANSIRATIVDRECLAVPHPKKRESLRDPLFAKPAPRLLSNPRNRLWIRTCYNSAKTFAPSAPAAA